MYYTCTCMYTNVPYMYMHNAYSTIHVHVYTIMYYTCTCTYSVRTVYANVPYMYMYIP